MFIAAILDLMPIQDDYRLIYNVTLAELTSLEEMMHFMMDDNQIHSDVINKLWQVYSKHLFTLMFYSDMCHALLTLNQG